MSDYIPSAEILKKYADVLIKFALHGGSGIKKGEVVFLEVPECAKPLLVPLQQSVLEAGGHPITHFIPDGSARPFYDKASDEQISFFPAPYLKGRIDLIDHTVTILAEADKRELEGVLPNRIMMRQKAFKPYIDWKNAKANIGKHSRTLALYGTEAMAREAGCSIEEYWEQIIRACYLDQKDPIASWQNAFVEIERLRLALNALQIVKLRVQSEGTDLVVGLGKGREWLGGSGQNIPSFELFISPDWRVTEGQISFDLPLYRYGNRMEGIVLRFKDGKIIEATAKTGQDVLRAMLAVEGADKIGEYSLTDTRLSKINRFMAETLFDENFGGLEGNTHLAVGSAYKECYPGDVSSLTPQDWKDLGYNESVVHTDIMSTKPRTVHAELPDGSVKLIYEKGRFVL